jgi:hypothetical protein
MNRFRWLCVLLASIALLACHATPVGVAAWTAAGTAGADAVVQSGIDSGLFSSGFGLALLNIVHGLAGAVAGVPELKAQLVAQGAQHSADIAALKASMPTLGDHAADVAGGAGAAIAAVRLMRGEPTPAHVKALPPAAVKA